ncbi:chymotrypsinogen B-like isoform X1 [Ranitomeya variabilis]|uniref:chymotrypsinogen B-like isoform X1 n=2 Tax=Ranitomeya variabilis TaxID=490064 RepID=UPI0040566B02
MVETMRVIFAKMGRFFFLLLVLTIVEKTVENCGVPNITSSNLMTRDVFDGEFPWQVHVRPDFGRFCSGTIIAECWIVSSANCFTEMTTTIVIETKDVDINMQERVYPIRRLIRHSDYNGTSLENSLALMEVSGPIAFDEYVMSACFPDDERLEFDRFVNCLVIIVEEITQGGPGDAERVLKKILFNHTVPCPNNNLTDIICATASNKDISDCTVNSGDPLMCQYARTNVWTVVGIAALEETVCNSTVIFARTASYITWVKESTELEGKPFIPNLNSEEESTQDASNNKNHANNNVYYEETPSEDCDENIDSRALNKEKKLEAVEMMALFFTQALFIILAI